MMILKHADGLVDKVPGGEEQEYVVFRIVIAKDTNGKIYYSPITEVRMGLNTYNKFKWDKTIIIDYMDHTKDGNDHKRLVISNNRQMLECVEAGICVEYEARNRWDEIFSQQKKEEMRAILKEPVDEPRS